MRLSNILEKVLFNVKRVSEEIVSLVGGKAHGARKQPSQPGDMANSNFYTKLLLKPERSCVQMWLQPPLSIIPFLLSYCVLFSSDHTYFKTKSMKKDPQHEHVL